MTDYYKEKLEAGLEYQDFVVDKLRKYDPAFIVNAYSSKKWQQEKGESSSGLEIKHDMLMKKTGNIYIEVAEKSNPDNVDYVPSGIYRDDNTIFYLIGDYEQAFLFSKYQLQRLYECESSHKSRNIKKVQTPTSKGFLYPIEDALRGYCIYKYNFSGE